MVKQKVATKNPKEYTFDEYRRTFLPKTPSDKNVAGQGSKGLGNKLAKKALQKIREALQ
jgi:hypothetical protein